MYLRQRLKTLADYSSKKNYEQIKDMLIEFAEKEEYEAYINVDEVYEHDIKRLEIEEELDIELLEGEEYTDNGCWRISWY